MLSELREIEAIQLRLNFFKNKLKIIQQEKLKQKINF